LSIQRISQPLKHKVTGNIEKFLDDLEVVFSEDELNEISTCKDFLQVRQEGNRKVKRNQRHYYLDSIISVGYRVK